ncbi:hypothetical protein [Pseudomonas sp.]|uniref:hypothetical protein n=1 Tax=Pseudomonas sp. TaxID=306 RepID=UPI0028A699F1|nr:hypothetical protein [Pseudomonas sp.]
MAIFLVVPTISDSGALTASMQAQQDQGRIKYFELPRGEFFVSYKGTSQELSDLLLITDGTSGSAIVSSVGSYYGRAGTNIWEWVQAHWE